MSRKSKTVLKIFGVLMGAVLVFAAMLVGWLTVTEYRPEPIKVIPVSVNLPEEPKTDIIGETLRIITFNIGYCGLGKESDFFMDGGDNVRNGDKEMVLKNLEGVDGIIKDAAADIVFVQEADFDSTRSFGVDSYYHLKDSFGGRFSGALNYKCDFVPYPFPPIGKVRSGIITNSNLDMVVSKRIALPCPFSWPVSAANLKRCLLVSYHNIEGTDKQLVAVNLHLEAYDDGEGKIAQTKMLWEILETEYAKGNYVVAGGDFNQSFPEAEEKYPIFTAELWEPGVLEESDLPEGWQYVYDNSVPTCRLLDKPYDEESSQHYVIDGFIISPNVELLYAETVDCGFEFSDHNPVLMEIKLK